MKKSRMWHHTALLPAYILIGIAIITAIIYREWSYLVIIMCLLMVFYFGQKYISLCVKKEFEAEKEERGDESYY